MRILRLFIFLSLSNLELFAECEEENEESMAVKMDIDERGSGTDKCHVKAFCKSSDESCTCTCNTGYSGDGETCKDIDECNAGTGNCDDNAFCANSDGSFICTCNMGYSGDGKTCEEIGKCGVSTESCDDNAFCASSDGSFICTCDEGYSGDGVNCQDIDECASSTFNDCHENANCSNTVGSYECICNNGQNCADPDPDPTHDPVEKKTTTEVGPGEILFQSTASPKSSNVTVQEIFFPAGRLQTVGSKSEDTTRNGGSTFAETWPAIVFIVSVMHLVGC